ncbi:MAG: nicotinate phosphoribosyltransferase [Chloroflexi bacterium]|jgi:nicotinate phosphoribosyltransferase|nr:nicotinate phosphoribosyltransferase [Chloroflexota bacterium]MBT3862840.1 nicotinate phosphoribosyltransferase [Chloroflexota bacterium]MBT4143351.1 nicotinate phosphoribosyltransferase [Chloroflexota bacterium]MBT4342055.1 nicotinate phosphoribosyltransferase [Chloroflexota bacterium]MBT4942916.1 nicotinate phosphoribosyltransferase [Chloroflexota bacterium]
MTTPGDFEIGRSVLTGYTADNELHRALSILRNEGINPEVVVEFTAERDGIFCGITEVKTLLDRVLPETGREVWAIDEGVTVGGGEVALRIRAPYASFGLFETAILGTLASCTGWATAASECVDAGDGIPVIAYGARHVHPEVVGVMDYSAVVGKCASSSSVVGQQLHGLTPSGTMPHSLVLLMGDTVRSILAFDKHMPPEVPRVALVDTFKDEAEEALDVAKALRERLRGIRLDTPKERGGVTPELVHEIRARLDQGGHSHVDIFVSGGITPERIREFVDAGAPVSVFAVGYYIAAASPISFTADIKEIDSKAIAKRGRIPGLSVNPRLSQVL